MANTPLKTIKFPGLNNTYTVPQIDGTLSIEGNAADAKAVGDEFDGIELSVSNTKKEIESKLNNTKNDIINIAGVVEELECGLTEEVKTALLACFSQVAWIGPDGQTYYDALEAALNANRNLSDINASFNQGSTVVYDTDELYGLKQYLTVTATYDDGTTREVDNYTLDGTLTVGTSTITVGYNKKSTTFNVNVTHQDKVLESITATFNSSASITTDNVLDDLRSYLTVHALYSDSTTETVSNYTLSGNLNAGTNTITVTYSGKTATFTVNVTEAVVVLQSITANFNQGSAVIYTDNTLNDLKQYLVVTANYSDGTTQTVTNYTLSGTLSVGTSVITVSYGGKTATFNVDVWESVDFTGMTKTNVSVLKGGTRQSYDYWYIYDNVTCANKTEIKYTVCAYNSSSVDLLGIAFYDSNGTYISGIGVQEADTAQQIEQSADGNDYLISGFTNIPSGATKMAISYHAELPDATPVFPEIKPLIHLR